jgi:hypothetical protein
MKYNIKVIPNSSQNKIQILDENNIKIHITTQPEKGKANKQVIKMLSKHFNVAKSDIKITAGELSSNKVIEVE